MSNENVTVASRQCHAGKRDMAVTVRDAPRARRHAAARACPVPSRKDKHHPPYYDHVRARPQPRPSPKGELNHLG